MKLDSSEAIWFGSVMLTALFCQPSFAQSSTACSEALVKTTYSDKTNARFDWRIAERLSETEYYAIKSDRSQSANVNASYKIFDVEAGQDWREFQENISLKKSQHDSSASISREEALNLVWTGISANTSKDYQLCIATLFGGPGIHIAAVGANENQVSLKVSWIVAGNDPKIIYPDWSWDGIDPTVVFKGKRISRFLLPLNAGPATIITLPRPQKNSIFSITWRGHGDQITVTPLPSLPATEKPFFKTYSGQDFTPGGFLSYSKNDGMWSDHGGSSENIKLKEFFIPKAGRYNIDLLYAAGEKTDLYVWVNRMPGTCENKDLNQAAQHFLPNPTGGWGPDNISPNPVRIASSIRFDQGKNFIWLSSVPCGNGLAGGKIPSIKSITISEN